MLLLCLVVSLCVFLFASLLYLYQRPALVVPPVGIHPLKEPSTYDGADTSKFKAWIFVVEEAFSARRSSPDSQDNSILILGDMNGKNNTWLSSDITDRAGDKLSCLFDAYGLHQHVDFPTRSTNGLPKSCIDLVVTNYQEHQVQVGSAPPISSSDHLSITGCLGLSTPLPTNHEPTPAWSWSWDNEKVKALQSDLRSTQFLPPQLNFQSCDDLWQHWRDTLLHKAHIYCTTLHKSRKTGSASLQPRLKRPWMNGDVLQAIKININYIDPTSSHAPLGTGLHLKHSEISRQTLSVKLNPHSFSVTLPTKTQLKQTSHTYTHS